jgi:hypothetical protein
LQRLWANLYPQDAALLRREFPQHDLFNDPIFATSECVEFEAAVTAAVGAARDEDPHLVTVQKALPAVCDSLRTVTGVIKAGLKSNDSSTTPPYNIWREGWPHWRTW